MDRPTNEERYNAFAKNNIISNHMDLVWGIMVGFDLAPSVRTYCAALGEDFEVEALEHDPMGKLILNHVSDLWEQRKAEKLEKRWAKEVRRVARRAAYADASEIKASSRRDGTVRFSFDTAMACMGLMAEILNYEGVSQEEPVVLNLLNRLPFVKNEKGKETTRQHDVPISEAENFGTCGYELYQLKTLWNSKITELWDIFERCLPTAIDRSSYHRRMRAPLIPGGFLAAQRVRVGELHVRGKSMQADGSGWYDPHHEDMADLMAEYGPVGLQYTAVNPITGHFFKGIIYPMESMNDCGEDTAAIQFDHLQVKGAKKAAHKTLAKLDPRGLLAGAFMLDGVHIGIMKAKTTIGKVSGCFETLENIGPNPAHYEKGKGSAKYIRDKLRVAKLIASLTAESVNAIGELGPQGLLGRATRDDPHLRRLAEFIALANGKGAGINPLGIPLLASKLRESLSRRMWGPANGAGIDGKYPMVVIDATLKPGTCVIAGYKTGTKLACWRFPTVLAQSLLVLEVVGGKRHHRVDDKVVRNLIYMNPHDITTCQQGDDDGDEVGISDDPRVIELFNHKIDNGVYHIEPTSEKLVHLAREPKGKEYLRKNPMGPVGRITIWRAALLAVGDYQLARAFSVLIQEAIDMQKNIVRMTHPLKASNLNNWYKNRNGEYHIHYKCNGSANCLCTERVDGKCPNKDSGYLTDNWLQEEPGFDMDVVEDVYKNALISAGCSRVVKTKGGGTKVIAGWPLGWRNQARIIELGDGKKGENPIRKAVALDNWKSWREKQDGEFSNWVHVAHDLAMIRWRQWHDSFKVSEEVPTKDVLHKILTALGSPLKPLPITWQQYAEKSHRSNPDPLRVRAGIIAYGADMKRIRTEGTKDEGNLTGPVDESARMARIDNIRAHLELALSNLSPQELLTVWEKELTDCWYYGRQGKPKCYTTDKKSIPEGVKFYTANKPNYAFMALCSRHSAIMKVLGMEASEACSWTNEKRLVSYVKWCRAQPDSYKALSTIIRGNKGHLRDVHDENGKHLHLTECKECTSRLETALVRSIRSDRTADEQEKTKTLISAMNKLPHETVEGTQQEEPAYVEVYIDDNPYG